MTGRRLADLKEQDAEARITEHQSQAEYDKMTHDLSHARLRERHEGLRPPGTSSTPSSTSATGFNLRQEVPRSHGPGGPATREAPCSRFTVPRRVQDLDMGPGSFPPIIPGPTPTSHGGREQAGLAKPGSAMARWHCCGGETPAGASGKGRWMKCRRKGQWIKRIKGQWIKGRRMKKEIQNLKEEVQELKDAA